MKMQTRPFVVEHKVSRRSEHHTDKSIWAGVDLAAVAQDVANDRASDQLREDERRQSPD